MAYRKTGERSPEIKPTSRSIRLLTAFQRRNAASKRTLSALCIREYETRKETPSVDRRQRQQGRRRFLRFEQPREYRTKRHKKKQGNLHAWLWFDLPNRNRGRGRAEPAGEPPAGRRKTVPASREAKRLLRKKKRSNYKLSQF